MRRIVHSWWFWVCALLIVSVGLAIFSYIFLTSTYVARMASFRESSMAQVVGPRPRAD
ncbi:MAG: hypothetical protein OWT27_07640 [Firmicutes bacterium]|nr:hypothetical protein [Bacillota bacterium]